MKIILILFVACMLLVSVTGSAQVPQKISYQGMLTTSSGNPLHNGTYDLRFDFYNLPGAGTLRHTETHTAVTVERGAFSLILGPLPAIFSESLFVEVTALSGPGISGSLTFFPRSELTSAPYALHSQYADTADYARNVPPSQWITNGSNIYYNSGNVGIGATNPSQLLEVKSGAASTQAQVINTSSTGAAALSMVGDGTNLVELTQYGSAYPGTWGPSGVANAGLSTLSAYTGSTGLMIGIRANAPIYFANNNTPPRMTILGDGNVGIGTTSPFAKLTVNGGLSSSSSDPAILLRYTGGDQRDFAMNWDVANDRAAMYSAIPGGAYKPISFTATGYYFQNGNVGIGTLSPLHKLHVGGGDINIDQGQYYRIGNEALFGKDDISTFRIGTSHSVDMKFLSGSETPRIFISNSTGNVGIGTTTPDANAKLDVNGYAFAKAPVVVYDSAAGSGINFDITWSNDNRIDNNIVEKQANNSEFMLKKVGWYRISLFMYFTAATVSAQNLIEVHKNGIMEKVVFAFERTSGGWWQGNGSLVMQSNGSDLFKIHGGSTNSFSVYGPKGLNQLSIEYLGAN